MSEAAAEAPTGAGKLMSPGAVSKLENPEADLSSSADAQNLKFERADWTSFRTVEGLQQKAGVAQGRLRRLVLKELTDNALDTGTRANVGEIAGGGYFVEDQGPGLNPSPACSASIGRWCRPSSCACRPVARSATASGWSLARCWLRTAS